jgi:hypothetical protein
MDAQEFVKSVRIVVMDAAVEDVVNNLTNPPGRKSAPSLLALSKWFLALSADDRDMVRQALAEASHAAVFGLFAVLDGARRVDSEQPPGEMELWHKGAQHRTKLSGDLHDLLT